MPLEQIAVKKPLFEPSKKPGKEHLEWCTDLQRIPKELPNVDKEIKTEKIVAKIFDEQVGAEVEKEINFPINEQTFNVDGYGYKLFSDKATLETRLMRWKMSGRGSSKPAPQVEFSDHYFGWFGKEQRKEADDKLKELNDAGMKVETMIITWTEKQNGNDATQTFQAIRGSKPYNMDGSGAKSQNEQTTPGQQSQATASSAN
jgi:hypothetical protein